MKLNGNILVVGDLGELKAYRVGEALRNSGDKIASLELIADTVYHESHQKYDEFLSDKGGRFGHDSGSENGSQLENEKRTLQLIREEIETMLDKESPSQWHLAFPKGVCNKLNDSLSEKSKNNLNKVLPLDLTKTANSKLLSYFE